MKLQIEFFDATVSSKSLCKSSCKSEFFAVDVLKFSKQLFLKASVFLLIWNDISVSTGHFCLGIFIEQFLSFNNFRGLNNYPKNEILKPDKVCSKKYGLTHRQIKFCRDNFDWMVFAHESAVRTQEECRFKFKARKWDCYSITRAPKFNDDLKRG